MWIYQLGSVDRTLARKHELIITFGYLLFCVCIHNHLFFSRNGKQETSIWNNFLFFAVFICITFDLLSRNSLLIVFNVESMLPCTIWNVLLQIWGSEVALYNLESSSHFNDIKNLTHGLTDGSWSRIFCSG